MKLERHYTQRTKTIQKHVVIIWMEQIIGIIQAVKQAAVVVQVKATKLVVNRVKIAMIEVGTEIVPAVTIIYHQITVVKQ